MPSSHEVVLFLFLKTFQISPARVGGSRVNVLFCFLVNMPLKTRHYIKVVIYTTKIETKNPSRLYF